jgi:Uma2 family endonuclease
VIFVRADRAHLVREEGLYAGPDLVVEVASPGTTSLDLVEKRDVYQRLELPEYWVVDLATTSGPPPPTSSSTSSNTCVP